MLKIYNTLTKKIEAFKPIHPQQVSMYVCGPTVYGPAHIGHARSAIVFDVVVRTFRYLNYQVKYIRNITDVGHLVNDADEGEDKVNLIARKEQVNPMEVAYRYTQSYHRDMRLLNVLPPNIEPIASGHMVEQIALVTKLLQSGYAYHVNGSVYFDVAKYHKVHTYGILSGRKIEELISGTRTLHQQGEKRNPCDFALWKKAMPNHLMHWSSPWGEGFPGWHLECTSMSTKYLGTKFDIHGGGLDLSFPHHECEIAQNMATYGLQPATYWMHHNLVTIEGEKMSKSAGNFITLEDCFQGSHPLLSIAYNPMVVRFFILQAHYRSAINFSDQALQAAQKGYYKLLNTYKNLQTIHYPSIAPPSDSSDQAPDIQQHIGQLCKNCYQDLTHDFHTAKVIAYLFELGKYINAIHTQRLAITAIQKGVWQEMKATYTSLVKDVLGLGIPPTIQAHDLIEHLLDLYKEAKSHHRYSQVEAIRRTLKKQGILVQDGKKSISWSYS